MMDLPRDGTRNGIDGGLQHYVIEKHGLALLQADLACGDAVDEVAHSHKQDSEEDIEAGHKDFGRQCIFC